jgi:DinB superfamily
VQETTQQYIQRMLGHVGSSEPVKLQAATPKKIERLLKGVASSKLRKRPAPGKWSVAEILAHLADTELVSGYRIRMILGAPGAPIPAFDQDAWAAAMRYEKRDPRKSLARFSALRENNLALLKTLTPEQWERYGLHAERGKETVAHIARLMAGHDINHLAQIERILAPKTN